jgi:hypothetical protein
MLSTSRSRIETSKSAFPRFRFWSLVTKRQGLLRPGRIIEKWIGDVGGKTPERGCRETQNSDEGERSVGEVRQAKLRCAYV